MLTTLLIILPIFALIGAGYLARKARFLGAAATTELNRFVVFLALPALLFNVVAHAKWAELDQPAFIGAFTLSCFAVFFLALLTGFFRRRPLADAAIDGLNAGYANTGFIGFPLCLSIFGSSSLALVTISAIITVCIVFAVSIVLIEADLQEDSDPLRLLLKVARSLAKNPLLIAPAAGAVVMGFGITLPASVNEFFTLLGDAASPCALVVLGLFFADRAKTVAGDFFTSLLFVVLKLLGQPAAAWIVAVYVFHMPPFATHVLVVLAALPTGTGPFMLAEFYGREAMVTSNTILLSTILSLFTISAYLAWIS